MPILVPIPSFHACAKAYSGRDLRMQFVCCCETLLSFDKRNTDAQNDSKVFALSRRMWQHNIVALLQYSIALRREAQYRALPLSNAKATSSAWRRAEELFERVQRNFNGILENNQYDQFMEMPWWWGIEAIHKAHETLYLNKITNTPDQSVGTKTTLLDSAFRQIWEKEPCAKKTLVLHYLQPLPRMGPVGHRFDKHSLVCWNALTALMDRSERMKESRWDSTQGFTPFIRARYMREFDSIVLVGPITASKFGIDPKDFEAGRKWTINGTRIHCVSTASHEDVKASLKGLEDEWK